MIIGVLKEARSGERRVSGTPETVRQRIKIGLRRRRRRGGRRRELARRRMLSPAFDNDLVADLAKRPITALAMDAVPRISRAQSTEV